MARVLESIWDVITTGINFIIETLESILGWILSAAAFVVKLILLIPIIGRLISWIWHIVLTAVWGILGLLDLLLSLIGVRPEKKLRLCTLLLKDRNGNLVANTADAVTQLQNTIDIFFQEANVRVIRSAPFQYDSGFAGKEKAKSKWVKVNPDKSTSDILDVECNIKAALEDLWVIGMKIDFFSITKFFYGNLRRLIGYGAPVFILIVKELGGSTIGCSLGPLTDYVTIEGRNLGCIAHELGHACNLWHSSKTNNLMRGSYSSSNNKLSNWQIALLRNSRHVTYF